MDSAQNFFRSGTGLMLSLMNCAKTASTSWPSFPIFLLPFSNVFARTITSANRNMPAFNAVFASA